MAQVKIEGHPHLVKDTKTGVITNTNKTEIMMARRRKELRLEREREEQELHDKIDQLSDNVSRLENMFHQLLENEYGNRNR